MKLSFVKYQGTGNDFVIIDNRDRKVNEEDRTLFKSLCDRHFGIGADGVILLKNHHESAFEMLYYNADGERGSMCGNGGRCVGAYADQLGIIKGDGSFMAFDGIHHVEVVSRNGKEARVRLGMADVRTVERIDGHFFLDTGSPHYVVYVDDIDALDVVEEGRKVRYNDRFKDEGTNVDFLQWKDGMLYVRTYERGVEDETLCCGTGVTAAALAHAIGGGVSKNRCEVRMPGGDVVVSFDCEALDHYANIYLEGNVEQVYTGSINIGE